MNAPAEHPELRTLKERCSKLKHEIRGVLEEWHKMITVQRPVLLKKYDDAFRDLEQEQQSLLLACAEIGRRVELFTIKKGRGERITQEMIDVVNDLVDREFTSYRKRLSMAFEERPFTTPHGDERNMVSMFRTLAKRLHPDSGATGADVEQWHQARQAYKDRDATRLRSLLAAIGVDDEARDVNWTVEEWREEVERLDDRLGVELRKLARLKREEPFSIAEELESELWIEQRRRQFEKENTEIQRQIELHKEHYSEMVGAQAPEVRSTTKVRNDQDTMSETQFMENTYFGGR
jgi:hypothetical protein